MDSQHSNWSACATAHSLWPLVRARMMAVMVLGAAVLVSGCDQLGIETPQKQTERKLAEAKAIGGACRHAVRAIEDCYTLNPKADKSAMYDGWREMDEYMRENSLEGIAPVVPRPDPKAKRARPSAEDGDEAATDEDPAADKGAH